MEGTQREGGRKGRPWRRGGEERAREGEGAKGEKQIERDRKGKQKSDVGRNRMKWIALVHRVLTCREM